MLQLIQLFDSPNPFTQPIPLLESNQYYPARLQLWEKGNKPIYTTYRSKKSWRPSKAIKTTFCIMF